MSFNALQLTLTGAAQQLSDGLPVSERAGGVSLPCQVITFQGLKANDADVFVGGSSAVTSAIHAFRVDPGDTQQPIVLTAAECGPMKLGDFWVLGTAAQVLVVGYVLY